MTTPPTLSKLTERFLDALSQAEFPFDAVLGEVVRYQWSRVPLLRQFWESRAFSPEIPFHADDIPAVPTDVFRHITLVSDELPARYVFRTSGTTSGARGEHHHLDTRAYDAGALLHFQRALLRDSNPQHFIHVAFPAQTTPDSSLSHMLAYFSQEIGRDERSAEFYFDPEKGLRTEALRDRLDAAAQEGAPVIVFGTAFGLADTLDHLAPCTLPPGSLLIQTGGFKGRREALAPAEFYQLLADHYGVEPSSILAEYGMTELSSQLWSRVEAPASNAAQSASRLLVPPPWCRVRATYPVTLRPVPDGEPGLLRFVDLANLDSVVAVQTSDLGIIRPEGVELIGRAPGATPRGCSLAIEELRKIAQR